MLIPGCAADPGPVSGTPPPADSEAFPLIVRADLKLYTQARLDAPVRKYLTKGSRLQWTGLVSQDVLELERNGTIQCYIWLEVSTPDGPAGWVYTDDQALNLDDVFLDAEELPLQVLLSPASYRRLQGLRTAWEQPSSAAVHIMSFRTLLEIKEELMENGRHYPHCWPIFRNNQDGGVPGGLIQRAAGEAPHWWIDFRAWLAKAQQTQGQEDDHLFSLYTQVYPADSVEYFYTAWQFPLPTGEVHSLLGNGTHLALLRAAEQLHTQDSFLRSDIRRMIKPMMTDLLDPGQTFWEEKARVLAELEAICAQHWKVVEAEEIILLHKRLEAIQDLEDGWQTNLRLGQLTSEPQDSTK